MELATVSGMWTVLVVDDEPEVVEFVRATLEDEEVRVLGAADGAAALAVAAAERPEVVLVDVGLPDLSALEACRRLRADVGLAENRIVMLMGVAQADDVERGLAGCDHYYLTKPLSPVRLLSLIDDLLPGTNLWAW